MRERESYRLVVLAGLGGSSGHGSMNTCGPNAASNRQLRRGTLGRKRRITGMEKEMRVLCIEDLASHGGLSYASAACEGGGEALMGVVWAGLLSRETVPEIGVPTSFPTSEGDAAGGAIASRRWTPRGRRTQARTKLSMRGNREIPRSPVVSSDAPSGMVRGVVVRHWRAAGGTLLAVRPR